MKGSLPKIVLLTILALALFLASAWGLFADLQAGGLTLTNALVTPISEIAHGFDSVISFFSHLQTIDSENEKLRMRLNELEGSLVSLEDLQAENTALLEQLNLLLPSAGTRLFIPVVRYEYVPTVGYLYAYKGTAVVKEGDWAVSFNCIVGQVTEVLGEFIKVRLLTASDTNVPVQVGTSGNLGYLKGRSGTQVVVTDVDAQASVQIGDEIYPWRPDSLEAEKYSLGRVAEVQSTEADASKVLVLEQSVNLYKLAFIVILSCDV